MGLGPRLSCADLPRPLAARLSPAVCREKRRMPSASSPRGKATMVSTKVGFGGRVVIAFGQLGLCTRSVRQRADRSDRTGPYKALSERSYVPPFGQESGRSVRTVRTVPFWCWLVSFTGCFAIRFLDLAGKQFAALDRTGDGQVGSRAADPRLGLEDVLCLALGVPLGRLPGGRPRPD